MSNSVVDYIRQQNPNETRSDAELTLLIGDNLPGRYDGYSDFKAQYDGLKASRASAAAPSTFEKVGQYGQQAVGSFGRAIASGIADIPESIAIGARGLNQRFPLSEDVPLVEMPTYRAGQAIRASGEAIAPAPVLGLEESFWASKVPQGIGSSAAFMAGGVATKALKVPGALGIAGLGSMSGAVQGYKDAVKHGASEDQAFDSYLLNAIVGTSEVAPLANVLNRMDGWSGGTLKKSIIKAGKETFEESFQEALQGLAGNEIAKRIVGYDQAREDFKDVITNAEVGGVTGAIVGLLASAVGVKLGKMKERKPEAVAKVEEVVPGLTAGQALARPPEVVITNKDVVENYTGPLTPERQELLAGIAQQKIDSGVDLSAGLPEEDRAAVLVIESHLRQAKVEQEAANYFGRLQAMTTEELIAQRDVMVKQGFDPKQIDALDRVIEEKIKSFESQVSGLPVEGGEQTNAEIQKQEAGFVQQQASASEAKAEPATATEQEVVTVPPVAVEPAPVVPDIAALVRQRATEGLLQEEPFAPVTPPAYRVSVQEPALMPNGQTMPGYVQLDEFQDGNNMRSTSADQLRKEGLDVPDFTGLPQGQYTLDQARQVLAARAVETLPAVVNQQLPSTERAQTPRLVGSQVNYRPGEVKLMFDATAPIPTVAELEQVLKDTGHTGTVQLAEANPMSVAKGEIRFLIQLFAKEDTTPVGPIIRTPSMSDQEAREAFGRYEDAQSDRIAKSLQAFEDNAKDFHKKVTGADSPVNEPSEMMRNLSPEDRLRVSLDAFGKYWSKQQGEDIPLAVPALAATTKPSLVDQIGFGNSVFKARADDTTSIGTKKTNKKTGEVISEEKPVVIQPAYHERMASEGYTPALAAQLVQNASPEGGQAKQNTHRATAFENTETGEVVVLGTFQPGGKEVTVVNPESKTGQGVKLETFLAQKNPDGEQLWTPLASMWFEETKKGFSQRFEDAKVFDTEVGKPAKEALAANARGVVAMEESMQAQGITAEGEVLEKASEASYTPKDMADEFRDVVVEWLPRDTSGKISSDLAINDIEEMLLSAFEQSENADVQQYALLEAVSEVKDDPKFLKLGLVEQQRKLLQGIAKAVYAKYKEGGFSGPDIQQGRVGQGILGPDALPQAGPEKLQAVAEDTAPGDGRSGSDTSEGGTERRAEPLAISSQKIKSKRHLPAFTIHSRGTVRELVDSGLPFSSVQKELLTAILSQGFNPKFILTESIPHAAAFNGSDGILLNPTLLKGKPHYALRAIVHETVHAATYQALRNPSNSETTHRLMSLMLEASQKYYSNDSSFGETKSAVIDHAFKNLDEFITAAFAEPRFRKALSRMSAKGVGEESRGVSIFDRFIKLVAKLLGIEGKHTLLDEVIKSGEELIAAGEESRSPIGETAEIANVSLDFSAYPEGSGVRYSAVTAARPGESRPLNSREIDDYLYTLNGLALQGVDVRVVSGLVDQLGNQLHGLYDNARKLAVLAVRDVQNPTRENLLASLEEAFHAAFAGESESTKRLMEAAFAGLNRTFLTAPGVNVAQVQAEETLAKLVADQLAAQGIQQSQNWAQRILAILRELYLRVSLAIQQGLFGPQHTRQELAVAYMQSRLTRFLAGQNLHPSFLEFIGGGKPTPAVQAGFFTNANGGGWVNEYWNPDTNQLERPEALENSLAAVIYNHIPGVRYKAVEMVTDPVTSSLEPAEVAVKIATQNAVQELYLKMFREWERLGRNRTNITFDQWKAANLKVDPEAVITLQNDHMQANGRQIVPRGTRINDLPAESSRRRAINNARMIVAEQRTEWSNRRIADALTVTQNAVALPKSIVKLMDLLARWTSKDALAKQAAEKTAEIVKEFKQDIRDIGKLSAKSGLLKQVIAGIEDSLDEPLMRQYEAAIERMFKRFVTDTKGERLVDLLETVSNLNIDWRNASARDIRTTLEISAEINPKLAAFIGKDFDSRALFSIATAFAKSNSAVVEAIETRMASTVDERDMVNAALKTAISDTADAIDKARTAIKGAIPRTAVQADRLLTKLEAAKKANRKLLDDSQRAKEFIDFHQDTIPVMTSEMAKLETVIGAMSEMWEANDGAKFFVAPSPNSTEEDIIKNQKTISLRRNGTTSADARGWIEANKAWLKTQPADERGAFWAALDRRTKKLDYIDAKLEHELIIQPGLFNRIIGAIQDRLDYIGLPASRAAAQRLRRKNSLKTVHTDDASELGVKVDAAKARAMNATGWKSSKEDFKKRFYNAILGYREKRKDILARNTDRRLAIEQVWAATYSYLSADPEMAAMISRPGAWEAIVAYVDLSSANNDYINKLKSSQAFGGKVEDEEAGVYREAIGDPAFDWSRTVGQWMGSVVNGMREAWGGTATLPLNKKDAAEAHRQDEAALKRALVPRFTPEVWREFVKDLAERPGRSLFYAPEVGGVNPMARFTEEAFDAVPVGDAVEFAKVLYQLEGGTSDLSTFIGETLSTFQAQYSALAAVFSEENQPTDDKAPVPARVIGDARKSEDFPSRWMDPKEFGSQEMRHMIELLSFEAAYGRNMRGMENDLNTAEAQLRLQIQDLDKLKSLASRETLEKGKSQRAYRDRLNLEADKAGGPKHLIRLQNAERNLLTLKSQRDQFHLLIKMQSGVPPELRSWFEMIGLGARLVVQRGGTALVDLVTSFEGPFRLMGISSPAFSHIYRSGKFALSETVASFFNVIGVEFHMQAEQARVLTELNMMDTDATSRVKDKVWSVLRTPVNTTLTNPFLQKAEAGLVRTARAIGAVLSTGVGRRKPGSLIQTTTFKPWAIFTYVNQIVHAAEIVGTWRVFTDLVIKGRDYYARNPTAAADIKNHRFTAQELGYKSYMLGLVDNARAFEYLNNALGNFGMNLESLARNALANPTAPVFSAEQLKLLAAIVRQEITLESDESNLAAGFFTNPILHLSRPLVGWGIGKSGAFAKSFRDPTGEQNAKTIKAGLIALFFASVPIGLAFAMMRDWWDEDVVGKKANVAAFGQGNDFAAMIDQLARVGTFGEIASPFNAMLNQDTVRPFSVDSRVFFLSSLFNVTRTLSNWGRQGTATYATVYRPLASSLGAGGFLETVDILNNLTGADNAESRVVARINVNNYLRAVGRELGLDVRPSSGGPALANSIKPHVSNMLLAALANDYAAFKDAHDKAVEAAREEGKPDPEDHVKRSFASYHPLRTVFRTPPSEAEYRGILSALNPRGQQDVAQAVDLYNRYAEVLGIKEFDGREEKAKSKTRASAVSPAEARMRAALGLRDEGIFAR